MLPPLLLLLLDPPPSPPPPPVIFDFLTFGEGNIVPKLRLSTVIHNSLGPLRTVRFTKQVIIEMYKIIT